TVVSGEDYFRVVCLRRGLAADVARLVAIAAAVVAAQAELDLERGGRGRLAARIRGRNSRCISKRARWPTFEHGRAVLADQLAGMRGVEITHLLTGGPTAVQRIDVFPWYTHER